jgi:hypothetical protein
MDFVKNMTEKADSYVKGALSNPYIMAVLKITLALYAAQLAPRLPKSFSDLFQNTFVKIAALCIMVYLSEKDFQLAILLAVIFVFGSNLLSGRGFLESFSDFSTDAQTDSKFKLIEPKSVIYPGCHKMTMSDLINAFEGDHLKMQTTIAYAFQELLAKTETKNGKEKLMKIAYATGLPYNVKFTDENAPYIATILVYNGMAFGGECIAPH